ncbi:hypothetical protein Tco_0853726 [Tanacetum coccineum]
METRVMEKTSYLTTTTLIYITTTDKHGVPPTKRLFRVAMLDPSQGFIDPWGKFGDLELPIKEEDSIADVENAVLDLGVVNPLCRSKSFHRHDHEVDLAH